MDLIKAPGSTHKKKRVGRGQGSGMGKTASKGHKGQRARAGFKTKRGFEGGQQPIQKRLPKVGFISRVVKPLSINVEKTPAIKELSEISLATIASVYKLSKNTKKVKLIGAGAKDLASKCKDENISFSGLK